MFVSSGYAPQGTRPGHMTMGSAEVGLFAGSSSLLLIFKAGWRFQGHSSRTSKMLHLTSLVRFINICLD